MSNQREFLRDHAIDHVWAQPRKNTQYSLNLTRMSSPAGAIRVFKLASEDITLPDLYSRWIVLQVGGVNPYFFNLFTRTLQWIPFTDVANANKVHANIYTSEGIEMPRFNSFYRYTENGALIVAVAIDRNIPANFSTDNIYLKVYSNSFWLMPSNSADPDHHFEVKGKRFESASDITSFNTAYQTAVTTYGQDSVALYVNGIRRYNDSAVKAVGGSAEFVIDTSVKRVVKLKLKDLRTFESTLDKKRKYIFHYPGKGDNIIDYFDDIDFYVAANNGAGQMLYYHRNSLDSVRQLTHKDYSIGVAYVQRMVDKLATLGVTDINNIEVVAVIRNSSSAIGLIHEASMIQELYKLPDELVLNAISGIDANLPLWQGATLEASAYAEAMRVDDYCGMTIDLVERAYGYHGMAKAIGDTFAKVEDNAGVKSVRVPYLYMFGSTIYEYNDKGEMIYWQQHPVGPIYTPKKAECVFVEFLGGYGGQAFDEHNNTRLLTLRPDTSYRVYLRKSIAGLLQPGFTDVTGSANYKIENNIFTWLSTNSTDYPVVLSDRNFYASDFNVDISSGRAAVTIQTVQNHNGQTMARPMVIPPGEFEVFMNGRSLIEGLEFFWREGIIYITARMAVNATDPIQRVHIRSRGFCNKDGSMRRAADIGFVQHNLLSSNKRFDLRDGRVVRIVVGGQVVLKDELEFSEDSNQVSVAGLLNGYPYSVKDSYVPLVPATAKSTYELIDIDAENAKKVSDYLTLKLPEPYRGPVVAQKFGYQVFSTFFSRLIMDLSAGRVFLPVKDSFTRQEVLDICKSYECLLEVDPISTVIDHTWLSILPHPFANPVGLAARDYQLLRQAVALYGEDKIDLRTSVYVL